MPKPYATNNKNLIAKKLIALRERHGLSQRDLAQQMQQAGYHIDKNVIYRIENNNRYVFDLELKAFAEFFHITYEELLD